jgi:hypothetical protein
MIDYTASVLNIMFSCFVFYGSEHDKSPYSLSSTVHLEGCDLVQKALITISNYPAYWHHQSPGSYSYRITSLANYQYGYSSF